MPVITNALTTLNNVKTIAGIALTNTTPDALLTRLINSLSQAAESYCGRSFARASYTETYNGNGRQVLLLRHWPVISVSLVTDNDAALTVNVDYFLDTQDKDVGRLYRPQGWSGNYYPRGMTMEPVAGTRNLEVTYIAGYYMPSDSLYVEGNATSLPIDISYAIDEAVVAQYNLAKLSGQGLKALSEGGLSYTWDTGMDSSNNASGISQKMAGVLNKYKVTAIA